MPHAYSNGRTTRQTNILIRSVRQEWFIQDFYISKHVLIPLYNSRIYASYTHAHKYHDEKTLLELKTRSHTHTHIYRMNFILARGRVRLWSASRDCFSNDFRIIVLIYNIYTTHQVWWEMSRWTCKYNAHVPFVSARKWFIFVEVRGWNAWSVIHLLASYK